MIGLLFDLDGVLVDTAKYHFLAWKKLAEKLAIPFSENDNELFKGVSRVRCMDILLELGNRSMSAEEKERYCTEKNEIYLSYIQKLSPNEVFPGAREFLSTARNQGCKIALGSASKNSRLILDKLELTPFFDAIIDGTKVSKAKPDPEVFVRGAEELGLSCTECIVFEDAVAGVQAGHRGGMLVVGVGTRNRLPEADHVISGFEGLTISDLLKALHQ